MADHLSRLLEAEGYAERAPQRALYNHLIRADRDGGVIAQAGTGVGKSIAVLAAAAEARERLDEPSVIVTPTRVLMDQYMEHDAPLAAKTFGLEVAELRGMSHYYCGLAERIATLTGGTYYGGCEGADGGCSVESQRVNEYACDYLDAKEAASFADIVVTNTDMWLVNDRLLGGKLFSPDGLLLVDEAHQLEEKMRDFAARSLNAGRLKGFDAAGPHGPKLAKWIEKQQDGLALRHAEGCPVDSLIAVARANLPAKPGKRARETQDAARRILKIMAEPVDSCVIYLRDDAIRLDWTNVASSSRETLVRRPYGLVSATVPQSMARSLGVPEARFVDVGHPFDYARQATMSISSLPGDFKSKSETNLQTRAQEVLDLVLKAGGGALLLFSAFSDLESVYTLIAPKLKAEGLTVLAQGEGVDNDAIGRQFKHDGNAVLFGSASFATGFDAPGPALRLVVLWKLPYPGNSPVVNAIRNQSWGRYGDMMKVVAVQGIGRLIRRDTDSGHVHIADSRGVRLLDRSDPLTAHLADFRRV